MDSKIRELYRLLLKDNWRVEKITRKTKNNLVIIEIDLVSPPRIIDGDISQGSFHMPLTTTYDTRVETCITISGSHGQQSRTAV